MIPTAAGEKYIPFPSMPAAERLIQNIVWKTGTIHADQIAPLCGFKPEDMDSFRYYMQDLFNKGDRISISEDRLVYQYGTKPDAGIAHCLWEVIANRESINLQLLERAEAPAGLFYVTNTDEVMINTYISKDTLHGSTIPVLKERYFARQIKHDDGDNMAGCVTNNIVVTDMDVAEQVIAMYFSGKKEIEQLMPVRICLVDYDHPVSNGWPRIEYFVPA